MKKREFNLAELMQEQGGASPAREQIAYLPISKLCADEKNFYSMDADGIEKLADSIALCGLQQPIRVRPDEDGCYIIVSGHRRHAAIQKLAENEPEKWSEVACIIEQAAESAALQQLRLIYANSATRKLSSADLLEQAKQVELILYQLKAEGYDFPGRMRDHVAAACEVSASKLARLKAIENNLCGWAYDVFAAGELSEDAAYSLSKLPANLQIVLRERIEQRKAIYSWNCRNIEDLHRALQAPCEMGCDSCRHEAAMIEKNMFGWLTDCQGCCLNCESAKLCECVCPEALPRLAEVRAEWERTVEQRKAERDADLKTRREIRIAENDFRLALRKRVIPKISKLSESEKEGYSDICGISIDDMLGEDFDTCIPIDASDSISLVKTADMLGVSIDWLLGRTENDVFKSDTPHKEGE